MFITLITETQAEYFAEPQINPASSIVSLASGFLPLTSNLHLPCPIFHLPASIFHLPASIFQHPSSSIPHPSSIFHLPSSIFHPIPITHYSSNTLRKRPLTSLLLLPSNHSPLSLCKRRMYRHPFFIIAPSRRRPCEIRDSQMT